MTEPASKICPSCQQKNNPRLTECWECHAPLPTSNDSRTNPLNKRCPCGATNHPSREVCGICGESLAAVKAEEVVLPPEAYATSSTRVQSGPKAKRKRRSKEDEEEEMSDADMVMAFWDGWGRFVLGIVILCGLFQNPIVGCLLLITIGVLHITESGKVLLDFTTHSLANITIIAIILLVIWCNCSFTTKRHIQASVSSSLDYMGRIMENIQNALDVAPNRDIAALEQKAAAHGLSEKELDTLLALRKLRDGGK